MLLCIAPPPAMACSGLRAVAAVRMCWLRSSVSLEPEQRGRSIAFFAAEILSIQEQAEAVELVRTDTQLHSIYSDVVVVRRVIFLLRARADSSFVAIADASISAP
eukprot:COSAG01_NODE_45011_length_413_cov_1.621019_1_plen_104_part_01